MKVTIETPKEGQEEEIIVRCTDLDGNLLSLIQRFQNGPVRIPAYSDSGIAILQPDDIFYFESVDNRTFAYLDRATLEVRKRLYEIETECEGTDFIRISKSVIVNISKIVHLKPLLYGRCEAELENGEKIIISRQYIGSLKDRLGI